MNVYQRIRMLISALPSDSSSVTLTRWDLVQFLEDQPPADADTLAKDLTVEEVGELVGRAPSTVRGWLVAGQLRGYKLNRRSWRVPRSAVREFLDAQVERSATPEIPPLPEPQENVDIRAWRKVYVPDR